MKIALNRIMKSELIIMKIALVRIMKIALNRIMKIALIRIIDKI